MKKRNNNTRPMLKKIRLESSNYGGVTNTEIFGILFHDGTMQILDAPIHDNGLPYQRNIIDGPEKQELVNANYCIMQIHQSPANGVRFSVKIWNDKNTRHVGWKTLYAWNYRSMHPVLRFNRNTEQYKVIRNLEENLGINFQRLTKREHSYRNMPVSLFNKVYRKHEADLRDYMDRENNPEEDTLKEMLKQAFPDREIVIRETQTV